MFGVGVDQQELGRKERIERKGGGSLGVPQAAYAMLLGPVSARHFIPKSRLVSDASYPSC